MTAGSGVVHSEMPSQEFFEKGGTMHGFQIWINLPRNKKRYLPDIRILPRKEFRRLFLETVKAKLG
ncbi:MAG: hypothetical protein CM1200mP28_09250 [Deltaproteobacteria bacterium]|nr:MAG: hypothetical protein CM1200mP28_09250 [Deltaproteobacteria bacterium]